MKKFIIILFILSVVSPVFAQSSQTDDIYYVNVSIERIYPSARGYVIQYLKHGGGFGTIGVPNEWFTLAVNKAEIMNLQPGKDWPTMSIFYRNGEFSYIRLHVHRLKSHSTWGNLPQGIDVNRFFANGDTLNIEY